MAPVLSPYTSLELVSVLEWGYEAADNSKGSFRVTPVEGQHIYRVMIDGNPHRLVLLPDNTVGQPLRFLLDDVYHELDVRNEGDLLAELLGGDEGGAGVSQVNCVMPGVVTQLFVSESDEVTVDQPLLILEAMKMENEIRSPVSGRVLRVAVSAGTTVASGALLIEIDSEA